MDQLADLLADLGGGAACRSTAAALHQFPGYRLERPFHVVLERPRRLVRVNHHLHTSTALERVDLCTLEGVRATSPSRTIIDLASRSTPDHTRALIAFATGAGLTSVDLLFRRIAALRSRGRAGVRPTLAVLANIEAGSNRPSWLEREFLELLQSAGLPRPSTEQVLARRGTHLIRVDAHFDGTPLVVELLGYAFHRTVMQMETDAERLNRLQMAGYVVLQFTYLQVAERPDWVVEEVRAALHHFSVVT